MLQRQPQIGYTLLDSSESSSVLRFNARHGITVAHAMDGATDLRSRIAPLTGARFTRQSVVYPAVDLDPPNPLPESLASRVAVFIFACGDSQYAIVEIFGIRDEFISIENPCGGLWITLDNPAVAAFVEYMTGGVWVNRFGYVLQSLEAAFVQVRP